MNEFKVGDKVKVIDHHQDDFTWESKISEVRPSGAVKFSNWKDRSTGTCAWLQGEGGLEIIKIEENKMTEFKIGDRIRSVLDSPTFITKGRVYVCTKDSDGDSVYFKDDRGANRFRPIERYEAVPAPKSFEELKAGDKVLYVLSWGEGTSEETVVTVFEHDGSKQFVIADEDGALEIVDMARLEHNYELPKDEKVTELTLAEIADKLNIPVQELRIKE